MHTHQKDIIAKLQREILLLQGYKSSLHRRNAPYLGPVNQAFPNRTFPLGAIHELVSYKPEDTAATYGFTTAIISRIAKRTGVTLWITPAQSLFPPALAVFGIAPENFIFLQLENETDILWATEEALKCEGLSAIVCETPNLTFTASRRFQLAVEQSGVTGFIIRQNPKRLSTTASIARWKITSLKSEIVNDLPGMGFPSWNVELLKVRNGKPGSWQIEFANKQFREIIHTNNHIEKTVHRKAG